MLTVKLFASATLVLCILTGQLNGFYFDDEAAAAVATEASATDDEATAVASLNDEAAAAAPMYDYPSTSEVLEMCQDLPWYKCYYLIKNNRRAVAIDDENVSMFRDKSMTLWNALLGNKG